MKKPTLQQELLSCRINILSEREDWKYINEHGCNDPFWPDGSNMNLVRNHILYYRHRIEEICAETGDILPEEYYLPVPPEVNKRYMASLKQKERVQRLKEDGDVLTTKKIKFDDDGQLRFA